MKHVALLRAINVGTKNRVKMADLVAALHHAGLMDATTYLQTGNILYTKTDGAETKIAAAIATLGIVTPVIVRDAAQMTEIAAESPFPDDGVKDGHRFVTFLGPGDVPTLNRFSPDATVEVVKQTSTEIYHLFRLPPNYVGAPKPYVDARVKIPSTTRNWTVVQALAALLNAR